MSELTKKLYVLQEGATEPEEITLYDSEEDCEEPNLKFEVDGKAAFAKLCDETDEDASYLRIYRNSDSKTYAVRKTAAPAGNYYITVGGVRVDLLPEDVETIAEGQLGLESIAKEIHFESTTNMKIRAFKDYSKLERVYLPKCRTTSNWFDESGAEFMNCTSLTSVYLPLFTTSRASMFYGCIALADLSLPSAVTLGGSSCSNCGKLKNVSLPLVNSVSMHMFQTCVELETIELPSAVDVWAEAFISCRNLRNVSLPNCTGLWGASAFGYCTSLTKISLPACTHIQKTAFNKSSLTEIHFAAKSQATIEALDGYANKFGATNATIYFDL